MIAQDRVSSELSWLLTGQVSEHEPVRSINIDSSPFRVGRSSSGSALTIPRPTVSNAHAEFVLDGNALRVRDLGSTNGTFVNGVPIHHECALNHGDLIQFADVVFRVALQKVQKGSTTLGDNSADRALALIQFDKLMVDGAVVAFFQPLVALDRVETVGYEVLGRSRLFGLNEPQAMFRAAAALNSQGELSRMFRMAGIREGRHLPGSPNLFLNTHPVELTEFELLELSLRELRDYRPNEPLTLEIHEAAVTDACRMTRLGEVLRDLNIGLAYDDFGAGQARLVELAEARPDYLKFDLKLIQGIEHAPTHKVKLLENLVRLSRDMGVVPVAEGIESQGEHETCQQIGFTLGQGYFYGKAMAAAHYRRTFLAY
jgi:EAL domain-containing protein (putative c-di-GMP-specific phosphodiesterase class I)